MTETWPLMPERTEVVEDVSENEVMQDMVKHAETKGWFSMGKAYGTIGGKVDKCCLPRVYVIPKWKMWLLGVSKWRPIAPHTKVPLKRVYNTVAKAYHFVLTQI